ncbi:MAG: putative bifunctional diguanylate cyclase/phosphodiesterase [Solirubrobacterales bacterium]
MHPATGKGPTKRFARAAIRSIFGLAIAAQVVLTAILALGLGSDHQRTVEVFAVAIMFAAASGALLTGLLGGERVRWPWLLLGVALLSYSCGEASLFFIQGGLTSFPTTADFFWLPAYPLILATVVLLVREQRTGTRLGISLDATIIALAIGALAYALLFDRYINVQQATSLVGGQLYYSMLDLAMIALLVLVTAPSGRRAGRSYAVLALGALALLVGDLINVKLLVSQEYVPGTLLDATWPAGVLLLGLASQFGTRLQDVAALRGTSLLVAVVASFAIAGGLIVESTLEGRSGVVIVLAGVVLCLILARLVVAVRENDRLARDNESIIRAAGDGIVRTDLSGRITYANPAAVEMLGYSLDELIGQRSHPLFHHTRPNGAPYPPKECPSYRSMTEGETQRITDELFWRKDGSSIAVDYTSAPIREAGRVVGVVQVFDDVTNQRQMKEQLRHQADHDSLTGLYNRRRFGDEVSQQLAYAQRYGHPGVLLMMDLDSFKFVNDSYGHPAGDKLLCEVAAILVANVRETDVVARLGGDEFAVLLREASEADGVAVAESLIAAVRSDADLKVGASVGVAPFSGSGERTPDELMIAADVALYASKEAGGDTATVYSGHNQALTWVERIRAALAEDRMVAFAQPIVDLESGEVVREELLVRMLDEHGDRILPASFLPAAERFGLIQEIDLRVLGAAIERVRAGRAVAVNVSALSLTDPRYLATLEAAVAGGLDPANFNLEITETAAVANMADAQGFAHRIRELGCSLALDDFGTGFSSFTYLKEIPAQYLKIDIEFVRGLRRDPGNQRLVQAIVSIARGLGQKTVAEGIEDEETLELVRALGVDYAQGFHIGRPSREAEAPDAGEVTRLASPEPG